MAAPRLESPLFSNGPFNTITRYGELPKIRYEIDGATYIIESTFVMPNFLSAEYRFRVVSQIKDGYLEAPDYDAVTKDTPFEIRFQYQMGKLELSVANILLQKYDIGRMRRSAQKGPLWYLQGSLTDLCRQEGGCCGQSCGCYGQSCGCCEKRPSHYRAMGVSGHCTWACHCCMKRMGIYLDLDKKNLQKEKQVNTKQYEAALNSQNPTFLLFMVNAYFSVTRTPQMKILSTWVFLWVECNPKG